MIEITSGPSGQTTSTSATFTWLVNVRGVAQVQCQLDAASEGTCRSPRTFSGLALGTHRFLVQALGPSGGQLGSDARSWTIVAPTPTITTPRTITTVTPPTTTATTTQTTTTAAPPTNKGPLPPLAHAIVGSAGQTVLSGTSGDDVILGLDGNRTLVGGAGDDTLVAGRGKSILIGGPGNDRLIGGAGTNTYNGGAGNDTIYAVGDDGKGLIDGGPGYDTVYLDGSESTHTLHKLVGIEKTVYVRTPPIIFAQNGWIYAVKPDGTGLKPIPKKPGLVKTFRSDPVWSPDRTKIAFVLSQGVNGHSELGGVPSDIWVMNADGSNPKPVTQTPDLCEREPEWSPDGTRIAYYVVQCTGAVNNKLEQQALDPSATPWVVAYSVGYTGISWRADGAYIYGGYCTFKGSLYRFDPWAANPDPQNSADPNALVTPDTSGYCAGRPSLSPAPPFQLLYGWFTSGYYESQGKQLPAAPPQGLYLKPADAEASSAGTLVAGFGAVLPSWSTGMSFAASWSGDGQHIVYSRDGELWTMNSDGTGNKDLGVAGSDPDWR